MGKLYNIAPKTEHGYLHPYTFSYEFTHVDSALKYVKKLFDRDGNRDGVTFEVFEPAERWEMISGGYWRLAENTNRPA